ncbi:MAG: hypothetical protein QNJ34_22745 [Xenococcaceae cyanobacterium MO_188.B29]|nr:hypothetical protein [Xenococcaceae cyanobacterium MO_188.B29]
MFFLGVFPVRRSFWVGSSGSGRVGVGFRCVVGLALAGGCCSWSLRASSRSFSGKTYQINNLTQQQQR